uniref:hypothetical protein n=1 Tax=Hafnia alvei TaxID=569 RepID=UPI00242A86CA|nr:hypothetical protein [Hafnia alvei]
MNQSAQYPYHQNFEFHLTSSKFMHGSIEDHGNNEYGANISVVTGIATPLPGTVDRCIPCQSGTTARMAFAEIIKIVLKESKSAGLELCLVVNEDKPKFIDVSAQKDILNHFYKTHEIPVQPFV